MAKAPAKKSSATKVTRITASEAKKPKSTVKESKPSAAKAAPVASDTKRSKKPSAKGLAKPFVAIGRYFKGAWSELRQVRWPDRKNTWAMTGALVAFTAFFVVVILFLDYLFSLLFKLLIGSN